MCPTLAQVEREGRTGGVLPLVTSIENPIPMHRDGVRSCLRGTVRLHFNGCCETETVAARIGCSVVLTRHGLEHACFQRISRNDEACLL